MKQRLKIVLICVGMAILYGIIHDLVTTQICLEYFTVFHPDLFHTSNPVLLALGWGVAATWWVGLLLGLLVMAAATAGELPKLRWRELVRPILWLLGASYFGAFLAGSFAALSYEGIPSDWLGHRMLDKMSRFPEPVQHRFLIDWFAHNASYTVSALGALLLCGWIISRRMRMTPLARVFR